MPVTPKQDHYVRSNGRVQAPRAFPLAEGRQMVHRRTYVKDPKGQGKPPKNSLLIEEPITGTKAERIHSAVQRSRQW
jgi:hypothetical protein